MAKVAAHDAKLKQATLELEKDIKGYDRTIKRHPDDDNAHYLKAGALTELGSITGDSSYFERALKCYDQAIVLSPPNAVYLVDRSKLHIKMERPDLAAKDIALAQEAQEGDGSDGAAAGVFGMYAANTTRDVLKLDSVQGEINKLIDQGELPPELAGVFSGMIQVITGISSRVSEHDDRLGAHDEALEVQAQELSEVKATLAQLQAAHVQSAKMMRIISSMESKIQELEIKVKVHDEAIDDINERLAKVVTKEEFEVKARELEKTAKKVALFDGRVKILEDNSKEQSLHLVTIDETLKVSGCFAKQKIKTDFEKLKHEAPHEVLFEYANNFYWTLSNYLLAYRAISTGLVDGVRDKGQFEKMWDKIGSKIVSAMGAIPVVGGLIELIEEGISSINYTYQAMKFEQKVAKINEVITSFLSEEDLSLAVASAAIKIAREKGGVIVEEYKHQAHKHASIAHKAKSFMEKAVDAFDQKIDSLLSKLTKINKASDTPASKMAVKDVILFINHIATSETSLVTKDNAASLDGLIANIFLVKVGCNTSSAIESAIKQSEAHKQAKAQEKAKDSKGCIIGLVPEIEYDNALLNHPDLLKAAVKYFGFNKALNLSTSLSLEIIREAATNNDIDMILAGMMSLDNMAEYSD